MRQEPSLPSPSAPPAEADPGRVTFSAGYFYSQDKWTSHTISGDFDPKIETNAYYGELAYGLAPGWDVYLRAGGIDAKLVQSDVDFKSDTQFFASIGLHGRLFEKKDWHLSLGPVANFGYYSN